MCRESLPTGYRSVNSEMHLSPGNLWTEAERRGERSWGEAADFPLGRAVFFHLPSSEVSSCFPSCCSRGLLRTCSVCFGGAGCFPQSDFSFLQTVFSGGVGAGSLWLPEARGLSRGLGAGRPVGRENELPGGGFVCSPCDKPGSARQDFVLAGKQQSLVSSLTPTPPADGSQHNEFKYRALSGA